MIRITCLAAIALIAAFSSIHAADVPTAGRNDAIHVQDKPLKQAALEALGEDRGKAAAANKELRAAGYAGLDALLVVGGDGENGAGNLARFNNAVDEVTMQKDAVVSRLYWYTDFNEARKEAVRAGKPILSLRLLGKLNEELSCEDSRFFRTTVYANAEIRGYLRDHFVLHWESVRPVPVVTIDMGDGRKRVRTIGGNSIHYVLDAKGRTVDGIPGLYGPAAFLRAVKIAEIQAGITGNIDDANFSSLTRIYHAECVKRLADAWHTDLLRAQGKAMPGVDVVTVMLTSGPNIPEEPTPNLEQQTDNTMWKRIAALHPEDAQLDADAAKLVSTKVPASEAARTTTSKPLVETTMTKMMRNLQDSIALDTVKNDYRLHAKIHEWLAAEDAPASLLKLNDRVYADLFPAPNSDPWLGFAPPDVYSAIDDGDVQKEPKK